MEGRRITVEHLSLDQSMMQDIPPDAKILIGVDKSILSLNHPAEKLLRIRQKDVIGRNFYEFIKNKITPFNLTKLISNIENGNALHAVDIQIRGKTERFRLYSHPTNDNAPDSIWITIKKLNRPKEIDEVKVDLMYLTNISSTLAEISDEAEVFEFLSKKLIELLPKSIILIESADADGNMIKLEKVYGIPELILNKIQSSIGYNLIGKSYILSDIFKKLYCKPKLVQFHGNMYDFCNNEIPEPVTLYFESIFQLKSIHTIGIANQGQFFGFIHLLSIPGSSPIKGSLIESIVYQCYLSIARIKSVKKLEERERQYKLLADNVKDVIFTLDLNLVYTYISPSIMSLRGYKPSELVGEPVYNSLSPESNKLISKLFNEEFQKIKNGQQTTEQLFEIELVHKNGSIIWNEVKASFIFDKNNKPIGILGVTRDINERKLAQQELLKKNNELKEANAQKDKFFSIIAHDLKSPFGHILNFSSLLNDNYKKHSEEKRKQYIQLILNSSKQIYLLLENLLDWSRSQRKMDFSPRKLKLNKIIADIVELFTNSASSKNIELIQNVPLKTSIVADEYMLKTILRNLVCNAIKFTPDGGKVTIDVTCNTEVLISVSDTGIGMAPDIQSSLFRLDVNVSKDGTNGEKGTGLGLLLCKEFVEKHAGRIWIESTPGQGSTFSFTIPAINSCVD